MVTVNGCTKGSRERDCREGRKIEKGGEECRGNREGDKEARKARTWEGEAQGVLERQRRQGKSIEVRK